MLRIIQNVDAVKHKIISEGLVPEVLDEDPGACSRCCHVLAFCVTTCVVVIREFASRAFCMLCMASESPARPQCSLPILPNADHSINSVILAEKPLKFKFTPEGQEKLKAGKGGGAGKEKEKPRDKLVWARPGTLEFESKPGAVSGSWYYKG